MKHNENKTLQREQSDRAVELGQHESVRSHVHRRLNDEVDRLERRIETLRLTKAPHTAIMISAYERMIDRKKGFIQSLDSGSLN
ncbi:hypothetical protein [Marinobacter zhejiangensis]|uniref:Transposase n=1 Tax=Marinobacter zhejiangensis TaxID=488535 RepID=A0A1I4LXX5_9GAMM|nr:hypothetical protein [Marinobacter zhejiangensis]SFL95693.1 hypothetical protein SAMN04487963_0726 [Marinobacter zhejiangensis]